ncbi:hypothetical protein [Jeotgalibaca arthritidis]|uniref:Uncharacterized protein n=1 Tax=Jeotgalibaca arthritidis TaxID=1868794 RepID=A0A6G7K9T4_9LACT|nr:hypothetical protein [Jeotgalibaca arthritidis]QII82007.1 hypothetical protein G7057_05790 [Jeotgalibaca arthritidis]
MSKKIKYVQVFTNLLFIGVSLLQTIILEDDNSAIRTIGIIELIDG